MSFSHVSSRPANANYVQQGRCRLGYARNNRKILYGSGHETGTTAANERGCRCRETSSSHQTACWPAWAHGQDAALSVQFHGNNERLAGMCASPLVRTVECDTAVCPISTSLDKTAVRLACNYERERHFTENKTAVVIYACRDECCRECNSTTLEALYKGPGARVWSSAFY
uniref:Uncharacterized protein n=1 Tax=Toxoplasma gondii (strain ATCC 50861 / VEG) TaxID=432359 RepID=A0A0F7VCC3_TOXGV|nr:TPA: hypothetical protein BN1205_006340 [Toxoplasma gondii VEG]